jgi:hypothetical protein
MDHDNELHVIDAMHPIHIGLNEVDVKDFNACGVKVWATFDAD